MAGQKFNYVKAEVPDINIGEIRKNSNRAAEMRILFVRRANIWESYNQAR